MEERVAQLMAHRACCGSEHDPENGKIHGYCVVCGVPWPCAYAGTPPDVKKPVVVGKVDHTMPAGIGLNQTGSNLPHDTYLYAYIKEEK